MFLEKVYTGRNQWYYYVFSLLIIFLTWQLIGTLPLLLYTFHHSSLSPAEWLNEQSLQTALNAAMQTNSGLALSLLTFVFGLIALFWCVRYINEKKGLDIITGRTCIDWKRIFFGAGIWGILTLIATALQLLSIPSSELVFRFEAKDFFILVLISLALFPLQVSFEEFLFRGYLMQWMAYLFKYRGIAVLLTGISFGLMRFANPENQMGFWMVMPQYILMGLLLSYITVKDNGIELALGMHLSNNILAAISVTSDTSALQTHALFKILNPTASHWDTVIILLAGLTFIGICQLKFHFSGKVKLWEKISNYPG